MSNMNWCIHIPGPDDIHAAPSKDVAEKMAAIHNADMQRYFDKRPPGPFAPSVESCLAVVIEYPGSAASHARALKEFYAAKWNFSSREGGAA